MAIGDPPYCRTCGGIYRCTVHCPVRSLDTPAVAVFPQAQLTDADIERIALRVADIIESRSRRVGR